MTQAELQRRFDAMITAADNSPLAFSGEDREAVVLIEGKPPVVVRWDAFRAGVLVSMGVVFDADTIDMVERIFADNAVPGLFVIDSFVHVAGVAVRPMSLGGAA